MSYRYGILANSSEILSIQKWISLLEKKVASVDLDKTQVDQEHFFFSPKFCFGNEGMKMAPVIKHTLSHAHRHTDTSRLEQKLPAQLYQG